MTPTTAEQLRKAGYALHNVAATWTDDDQHAFDTSATRIRDAFGMSLDEVAAEILAFIEEARP